MTKETLLKYKKIYEGNGDTKNLSRVEKALEAYEPQEKKSPKGKPAE